MFLPTLIKEITDEHVQSIKGFFSTKKSTRSTFEYYVATLIAEAKVKITERGGLKKLLSKHEEIINKIDVPLVNAQKYEEDYLRLMHQLCMK